MRASRIVLFLLFFIVSGFSCASAKSFDYLNALTTFINLTQDTQYKELVDEWMEAFRYEVYSRYKNDQFSFNEKRKEMKTFIQQEISSFDKNEPFEISTSADFGSYDFNDHVFELNPFTRGQYFTVGCPARNALPGGFRLSFSNPDVLNGMPMEEGKAKVFLEKRKYGGFYNQKVTILVKAVPMKATQSHEIVTKIIEISVLDQEDSNKVLYRLKQE